MKDQLQINRDGSERICYCAPDFPVRAVEASLLSDLQQYAAGCHWHDDFEFVLVNQGEMDYFVNGSTVTVSQGQGIFVNARRLHYGFSRQKRECLYDCMLFHPSVLGELPLPMARHATQLSADSQSDCLILEPGDETIRIIRDILTLAREQPPAYELEVQAACARLTRLLWQQLEAGRQAEAPDPAWATLRQMVGYIQANYGGPIRLEQIAAAGAVCRSKCCRLFREKMGTSPIGYLNDYRLSRAEELLKQSHLSITEIAYACGFDSPSYFSEAFRKRYGLSPRQIRV